MSTQKTFMSGDSAEVVIIGGGVIGLSIARALTLRGVSEVMLLERASLGAEASFAAGGILAPQAEADQADEFFNLACNSRDMYPAFAATLLEETGIDIELDAAGTLYVSLTEHDEAEIERRYEWQTRAGLSVEKLTKEEARRLEPCISENIRGALSFPLDIQVENRRLLVALIAANEKHGVRLITNTTVASVRIEHGRVAGVETSRGFVSTRRVVVAAGSWTSFITASDVALPRVRIEPVRGQMVCLEANPRIARHVLYSPRGYLVPRADGRLLAGSTSEHAGFEKHVTASGLHSILSRALEIAPAISGLPVTSTWAGLRPRAEDDLPVLGPCAEIEGLFYATGHYRNGILLAPLTGELIAEAIAVNVHSDVFSSFAPGRFELASVN
jgi:glycine oxidase